MTKRALIIGPSYNPPYTIQTTVNDIPNWMNTLQRRGVTAFTVKQGSISRNEALAALQSFVNTITVDDTATIVMLGHGSRLPGNEPDGYDECWVSSNLEVIRDHELEAILGWKRIDFVSDFCFAGTSTDGAYIRTWCACGPNQMSYGCVSGGVAYALFSLYLCWALRTYPTMPANQIMDIVKGYVTAAAPLQVPQLDGVNLTARPF